MSLRYSNPDKVRDFISRISEDLYRLDYDAVKIDCNDILHSIPTPIVDFENKTEFMLSAVIYVNRDGILNDDKYEYTEIGYPFFREIGEIIYTYDKNRKRAYLPDLRNFKIRYDKR